MVKKAAITTPAQMLDGLLLDCIEHDNGYIRCRHCRASSYPKEPLLHDGECVVGQILVARATQEIGDPHPAAAPDAGEQQDRAGTKERPEPINTETLRNIRVWLATMKRLPAPPSALEYVESLLNEVEYLRAYVPPPPSRVPAHQEERDDDGE